MSMLLAHELALLGVKYIGYEDVTTESEADYLVEFDLPIIAPQESTLFINQDKRAISCGDKISFPSLVKDIRSKAVVAHAMVSFPFEDTIIIDSMQRACDIEVEQLYVLEGDDFAKEHPNAKLFKQSHASVMSVMAENSLIGKEIIGVYFGDNIEFLYCKSNTPITVIPSVDIECDNFWQSLSNLRVGSDRLVHNYREKYPQVYSALESMSGRGDTFKIAAKIIGVADESLDGIAIEALGFLGKAGLAIDTHIKDNRFNSEAFLASIISYKLADVERTLLCYSIFESIGDYIGDGALQLCEKSGSDTVALSGKNIANQILYGRLKKKLGSKNIVTNIEYPLSKENALYGALYL
jgi:hydrogenase maturation protein HypF